MYGVLYLNRNVAFRPGLAYYRELWGYSPHHHEKGDLEPSVHPRPLSTLHQQEYWSLPHSYLSRFFAVLQTC